MKSVCSGVFWELLLFSAVVLSYVALPVSSMKECIEQKAQEESPVVIKNIGIKMCQVRCIETGGCLRFEFDIETLTCRLRLGDSKGMEEKEGFQAHLKTHSDVTPGPCSSTSCSLGDRCLESRYGKPVCVKGGRMLYPGRSQQQRRDKKSGSGDNLLHEACREGDLSRVRTIMSKGQVDIDSREGEYGMTPVMLAARGGHRGVFEILVGKRCNMSLLDNKDSNILHMACYGGQIAIVKRVLSLDIVDINSRGHIGSTCVMVAAANGHRKVFDLVMSKGGDASLADKNGDNILHWACRGGDVEMVKYVISLNFVDINSRGHYGRTPMMVAAAKGHRKVFDLAMSKGDNASLVEKNGDNILHWACRGGDVEMVKYVISLNFVDINSRGHYGRTPMMVAAAKGHRKVFDLVMSKGGDASLVDENGHNILHLASWQGNVMMVKHILSKTIVDVNAKDKSGATAAMIVNRTKHKAKYDLLKLLG